MVSKSHSTLSIVKQCEFLGVSRSTWYAKPNSESALNLELMDKMDRHYMDHPYKGAPRIYVYLTKDLGYEVSQNRVDRLYYKVMGLRAIMPGPHTSKRNKKHTVYPYLLRDLCIEYPGHVWATDITYIGVENGFMYLTAVIDVFSRKIMNWSLSNTMSASWCSEMIQEAFELNGTPKILNTDQGVQYTSNQFVETVLNSNCRLSIDGKGRATDNALIERFWRSIKYEKLYLNRPKDANELYLLIAEYMEYYNNERRHSSIEDKKPAQVYGTEFTTLQQTQPSLPVKGRALVW